MFGRAGRRENGRVVMLGICFLDLIEIEVCNISIHAESRRINLSVMH